MQGPAAASWRTLFYFVALLQMASSATSPADTGFAESVPDTIRAHDQLCGQATVAKGLGEFDAAIQRFAQAAALLPNSTVAWTELGIVFAHAGDSLLAERCLMAATRTDAAPGVERASPDPRRLRRSFAAYGWKFEPVRKTIHLGDETPGAVGEDDEGVQHERRYRLRLYERFYELDCALRRLRQRVREDPGTHGARARTHTHRHTHRHTHTHTHTHTQHLC